MSLSVLAKSAEMAWALLESYDIDPVPLFQEAHIDPKTMSDMHSRISQTTTDKLWRNIAEQVNDPCFAVRLSKLWHPSYMHVLGYAWLTSSTLRSALNRLARYGHIVNQSTKLTFEENDGQLHVVWANPARQQEDYWHADAALTLLVTMCRANYGADLEPILITLKHDKPISAADFFEYFRCPVEFGAKRDSVVLLAETVDKRLSGSNPFLSQINDQLMVEYLAKLDEDDIVHRVKAAIIELLPDGRISDVKVATKLYMGNRTLQRRLEDKGTTFQTILTDVRKEMAVKYIQDSQLTLTELSFQLGFSEMSSFSRAFKGWTGLSPKEFRLSI